MSKSFTKFVVICINNKDKPDGIPNNKWLELHKKYTVIAVDRIRLQNNQLGFKLAEIDLDSCFPYQYFSSSRFGIPMEDQVIVENYLEKLLQESKKEELVEI